MTDQPSGRYYAEIWSIAALATSLVGGMFILLMWDLMYICADYQPESSISIPTASFVCRHPALPMVTAIVGVIDCLLAACLVFNRRPIARPRPMLMATWVVANLLVVPLLLLGGPVPALLVHLVVCSVMSVLVGTVCAHDARDRDHGDPV